MWPQRRSDRVTHGSTTHAARFAFDVATLEVNTMDLTTLIGSHDTHFRLRSDGRSEVHARADLAPVVGTSTTRRCCEAWKTPRATLSQTLSSSGSVSPACGAHLDPSRRRCSPHAPTSPRPHAGSRSSSSCGRTSTRSKGDRTAAPLRPTTDRPSGPITALPTGFWRQVPKATQPIYASRDRKRHRRSQLFRASDITQHDAGDGSITHATR
jgi:hypothetical protein